MIRLRSIARAKSPKVPRPIFLSVTTHYRPTTLPTFVISPRTFHTTRILGANFPFKLHDIGEGIAEVELVKWYVEVGQKVEEFDVLCEVQSDKSTVELTSPTVGVVKRLGADEGVVLKVGEVVCDIETDSGGVTEEVEVESSTAPESAKSTTTEPLVEEQEQEQERDRSEESITDESLHQSRDDLLDTSGGAQFSGEAAMLPSPPPFSPSQSAATSIPVAREEKRESKPWSELRKIVKASPAVRTLAARMGVSLGDVKGTGEGGRVLRDDITSHSAGSGVGSGSGVDVREETSRGSVRDMDRGDIPAVTRVEFGRTRKVMYRAMGDMGSVPHFGYTHTLNLTPLLPYLRSQPTTTKKPYQASDIPSSLSRNPIIEDEGEKVGLLSFLVKGLILALEVHPIMRSRVKFANEKSGGKEGEKWLEIGKDGIIGVAVSDPKYGLLTPSLPALPPHTPLSSITHHLTKLRQNATKPSPPANITISSVGGLGEAQGAMPVLPPGGGVAICAVGRASWGLEPRLSSGKRIWDYTPDEIGQGGMGMEGVLRCSVGWSGDHRVLEGAELIAFTETWKMYIEEPWRWMKVN